MFKKILIANRGEIACRIIKTAKSLGITTVAVYSDADRGALHTQLADETIHIGPSSPHESYLNTDNIIKACKKNGAQAIHPGYGFLSENSQFCERVAKEGLIFIGPPAKAIAAMGDKITSKRIAAKAGVQIIPGFDEIIKESEQAVCVAREIGYPVMLKATAGGGGKGMRMARNDAECRIGFERARSEARSSFGDDRILIEKFIENPRHIEIQIIADTHGNTIYLGERECSLQRRHQKVIEEAPSSFLDAETRKAMGRQAVLLAQSVNYHSAGTVEFIVDANRNFYFLEMNTRLQVEHPVTELITGLDLVELMFKIASGQELPFTQEEITIKGWSLEARIYAEDPFSGFLPSTGRITSYLPPDGEDPNVRVDTGVFEGGEISMYYDPMIAKLITYGNDRKQAIAHMREKLDEFVIRGVNHNIAFLEALLSQPNFINGDFNTNFIAQQYPDGFDSRNVIGEDPTQVIVVAATIHRLFMDRAASISGQLQGHERRVQDNWVVVTEGNCHKVSVRPFQPDCSYMVEYNATNYKVMTDWSFGQPLFHGSINGEHVCFQIERKGLNYLLLHRGSRTSAMVMTPTAAELLKIMPKKEVIDASRHLLSPMPGLLIKISVQVGQQVRAGDELAIIEAMKMENVLKAAQDGTVKHISTHVGNCLDAEEVILEFE